MIYTIPIQNIGGTITEMKEFVVLYHEENYETSGLDELAEENDYYLIKTVKNRYLDEYLLLPAIKKGGNIYEGEMNVVRFLLRKVY